MTEEKPGFNILVEIGLSHIEAMSPNIEEEKLTILKENIESYIREKITFEQCNQIFMVVLGKNDPVQMIHDIINLSNDSLPSSEQDTSPHDDQNFRKKTRTWSSYEDQRLIGGVYRFGLENWSRVAAFVGNNRTRSQCSQRWTRGLNPRICKKNWTPEEDEQLKQLVRFHGDKSWTKIASILGNRSDVQCRYHYHQISKEQLLPFNFMGLNRQMPVAFSSMQLLNPGQRFMVPNPTLQSQFCVYPTRPPIPIVQTNSTASLNSIQKPEINQKEQPKPNSLVPKEFLDNFLHHFK